MRLLILSLLFLLLTSCGRKVEQPKKDTPQTSEATSDLNPTIEVKLEAGYEDSQGYFSSEYTNTTEDRCLVIPEKIENTSGVHDLSDKLKLSFHDWDMDCRYLYNGNFYQFDDCYDERGIAMEMTSRRWFSDVDETISLSFIQNSSTQDRTAQVKLNLNICGL